MRKKKYKDGDEQISNLFSSIKARTKGKDNDISNWSNKDQKQSREEFIKWYKETKKECFYCGIKEEELKEFNKSDDTINKRRETRGSSLEVDRFDDKKGYIESNCCLACYWCNNAKTDTFNEKEMLKIGKEIGKIIKDRLNKILREQLRKNCHDPYWSELSEQDYNKEVDFFLDLVFEKLPKEIIQEIVWTSNQNPLYGVNDAVLETGQLYRLLKNSNKVEIKEYSNLDDIEKSKHIIGIFDGDFTNKQINGALNSKANDYIFGFKKSENKKIKIIFLY